LGGKTVWYAEAGATSVIGLDLDPANTAQGARFAAAHGVSDRVRFVVGDAVRLPFDDGRFDALTANDAMEHFADPAAALVELSRVLRPGGRLYVSFPPYRSPHGAHLYDYVHIPWCQNLMSRRLLYGTLRRSIEEAARARDEPDAAAWIEQTYGDQVRFFETDVNGMTIGRFHEIVRATPVLRLGRIVYEPPKFKFLRPLTRLPWLREYVTGLVVAELVRT
jgi:ubiquinone/menaquinone biosynthesis C-methylase UbiE